MDAAAPRTDPSHAAGPLDQTRDPSASPPSASVNGPRPVVRLVERTGTELTRETRLLLRSRLRMAALVLGMGSAVFILWRLIAGMAGLAPRQPDLSLIGQALVVMVLASCAWPLCRTCELTSRTLRFQELAIFGAPALFFFVLQYANLRTCAVRDNTLPRFDAPWVMLVFTYAIFIPNTWRRAALVIGAMAVSPILLTLVLWLSDNVCMMLIAQSWGAMIATALIMLVSGVSAVVGVYTINALRVEAFEARQFGQYKLGRLLGSGGMGEVYLAEHQLMKRPCAIKVIRPEKAGDPRTLTRFEREVRASAKLSHWNSIDIFDYGRAADGTFYYVMEYLPGLSLADLVSRYGPLPPERVVFLLRQTCDALAEAHALGLVHRDIKPGNIFAAERGGLYDVAKLLDFGMVKPFEGGPAAELTHDGVLVGSPLYMSPEQVAGDVEPDGRSDIYSLGVVAYHLLAGRPPFDGAQMMRVLIAHASQEPEPLERVAPDVPPDLSQVVMRCLAKRPADRYPSVAALAAALDRCEVPRRWSHTRAAQWWAEVEQGRVPAPSRLVETT